jgi:hypothetical protein
VREEDGEEVVFTMPDFVEQGDELGEIALLVIRARQRWRELKGLGAQPRPPGRCPHARDG